MPRPIDVLDNIVSPTYMRNYQFGLNADLEEVKRYNQQAKEDECPHQTIRTIELDDDRSYYVCEDCRAVNPQKKARP